MTHMLVHFESYAGVPRTDWDEFCVSHKLAHLPAEASNNTWHHGDGIEVIYGGRTRKPGEPLEDPAYEVMFRVAADGPHARLVQLARVFWVRFGGVLYAEPVELRHQLVFAPPVDRQLTLT